MSGLLLCACALCTNPAKILEYKSSVPWRMKCPAVSGEVSRTWARGMSGSQHSGGKHRFICETQGLLNAMCVCSAILYRTELGILPAFRSFLLFNPPLTVLILNNLAILQDLKYLNWTNSQLSHIIHGSVIKPCSSVPLSQGLCLWHIQYPLHLFLYAHFNKWECRAFPWRYYRPGLSLCLCWVCALP